MTIKELLYRIYGLLQISYHRLRNRKKKNGQNLFFAYTKEQRIFVLNECKGTTINGMHQNDGENIHIIFKGDNYSVTPVNYAGNTEKYLVATKASVPTEKWLDCINNAIVEPGWANSGFYLTAYTKETKEWGLSNWIWTSAAIGRTLSTIGKKEEATKIANTFIRHQLPCGGWIVRYDLVHEKVVRLVAPNDSAYIARNSLLVTYRDTNDKKYLDAAIKCADWIMKTSRYDGIVLFGYDFDTEDWITDRNIVDIGFTACLFADLFEITEEDKYKTFLEKFINTYIRTFYDTNAKLFASHINKDRKQNGGYFSRGQAWALEGLISAYNVLKDEKIYKIIEDTTQRIVMNQRTDGGWYCNFQKSRSLMGEDCKGIAPIGKVLLDWSEFSNRKEDLINSTKQALHWCEGHTDEETGMILSFSCNGAISHSLNTSTGMLYANAYALEIANRIYEPEKAED